MDGKLEFRHLADCTEAVPMVAQWWFGAWGPTKSSSSAEALAQELAQQLNRKRLPVQLVALQRGEVVGTAVLKEHELRAQYPDLKYWLGNVFVREQSRGLGVGAALVKRAEGLALGLGLTRLHLATERADGGLYAQLGYEVLHRTRKGLLDVAVMVRNLDALVRVVPYDEAWPARFREEAASLGELLKPWLVGPVEHIGSTAVPGLPAKPVVDMMAGVRTLEDSRRAIPVLVEHGYVHFDYRTHIMHWLCKPAPWRRTHHLHLVPFESPLWTQRLAFRDRLRQDRNLAAEYAGLKLGLAREHEFDREAYTDNKEPFVRRVVEEALGADIAWAR